MKKIAALLILWMVLCTLPGWCLDDLKVIETWEHEFEPLGRPVQCQVDSDGHLLACFQMIGNRLITPQKVFKVINRGQGPDEVTNILSIFHYGTDMAVMEMVGKVKIFSKKGNNYVWKETKWQKRDRNFHAVSHSLFYHDKWFFAGYELFDDKNGKDRLSYLNVYNEKGERLKRVITDHYKKGTRRENLARFVVPHGDRVLFLVADALQVRPVSVKPLVEEGAVDLEKPAFYKKMPGDFYAYKKYANPWKEGLRDISNWMVSYSRIAQVVIDGDHLVLQVRTCSNKLKKFALLFYRLDNFKLAKTVYLDDALLGAKDGRFYCFANGEPGLDEEAEDFTIKIYGFVKP